MAGEVERLSGKLGIDTTDFKTAISSANRELRVLETSFKAGAAALGDWSKDATGLESRIKSLTSQIDIQKLKVDALRAEHQRLVEANGANSRAAQDAEIKLNKETETLNKMQNELGTTQGALTDLAQNEETAGAAAEQMGQDVADSGSKMETFKTVMGGVGTVLSGLVTGILAVGAAAVTAVGAMGGLMLSTANAAGEIEDMSVKTGISTEHLQEYDYIAGQIGTSLDTITGAQAKLVRSMAGGADGTGTQADAFKTLGVSVVDAQGNLRDTQTVFGETIDALGQIQNPAERDALAMDIFGKSAQELNPLIKAGSGELETLAQKAHDVGAVVSDENVSAFDTLGDTLASLQAGLKGTVTTLLSAFLPSFQGVFDQAGGYLQTFKEIVDGSGGDISKVAQGLTGLITQIATDLASQAPQMLQAGLGIVQSILTAITAALPSLLDAAIAILTSLINFIVANLPTLIDAAVKIILTLVNALVQNLPMLIEAAVQAVVALANGLASAMPTLIPTIVDAIILIANTLVLNAPLLITAALALIQGLADGLIVALPNLIAAIPPLVNAILSTLLIMLPQIAYLAAQIIGTLAGGIVANVPVILGAIGQLIAVMAQYLQKLPTAALQAGKNFISGIVDGINNAKGALFNAVTDIATNMVQSLLDALQIKSPSRKGKYAGRNYVGSVALGGYEALSEVEKAFSFMGNRISNAMSGALSPSQAGATSSSVSNNIPVFGNIFVQGNTTTDSFANDLMAKRY